MSSIEAVEAPDMMKGTLRRFAASSSIRSAPGRKRPAMPVGEIPKGLVYLRPKISWLWSRSETSTR